MGRHWSSNGDRSRSLRRCSRNERTRRAVGGELALVDRTAARGAVVRDAASRRLPGRVARGRKLGSAVVQVRDDVVRSDVYIDNMVLCGKCGAWKPLDQFHQSSKRGHQHWCKDCRREYDCECFARNRIRRRRQAVMHRRRLAEWMDDLKATNPCADCGGFFHPQAMTWDHLPGRVKIGDVSSIVRGGKSRQAREEIRSASSCARIAMRYARGSVDGA